jgi:hypothetical protein
MREDGWLGRLEDELAQAWVVTVKDIAEDWDTDRNPLTTPRF